MTEQEVTMEEEVEAKATGTWCAHGEACGGFHSAINSCDMAVTAQMAREITKLQERVKELEATLAELADEQALFAAYLPPIYMSRLQAARNILAQAKGEKEP